MLRLDGSNPPTKRDIPLFSDWSSITTASFRALWPERDNSHDYMDILRKIRGFTPIPWLSGYDLPIDLEDILFSDWNTCRIPKRRWKNRTQGNGEKYYWKNVNLYTGPTLTILGQHSLFIVLRKQAVPWYPLVNEHSYWKWPKMAVDLPIQDGDFPFLCWFSRGYIPLNSL